MKLAISSVWVQLGLCNSHLGKSIQFQDISCITEIRTCAYIAGVVYFTLRILCVPIEALYINVELQIVTIYIHRVPNIPSFIILFGVVGFSLYKALFSHLLLLKWVWYHHRRCVFIFLHTNIPKSQNAEKKIYRSIQHESLHKITPRNMI